MDNMLVISTDMMQTVAIAILVFYVGKFLRKKITFFEKFCVPAPVIGGFLFAIIHLILKANGIATFEMDGTLKNPFMMVFFTTIGLSANLATLKKGGKGFVIFLVISTVLVLGQNVIGSGLAKILGQDARLGLLCGSITMVGGHGTAGAWGPDFEAAGLVGGEVIGMAAATFGVIMGSLIGGPIASMLIRSKKLTPSNEFIVEEDTSVVKEEPLTSADFLKALAVIFVSIGLGVILKAFLKNHVTIPMAGPLNLPEFVTSMLFAAVYVNTLGKHESLKINLRANDILNDIGINVFLTMALMTLDLTQLKAVFGPMLIILFAQTIFMALYAILINFNIMGRDYDAAVLTAGICGFGMGATYNAIANMNSVTEKFGPSPKAYFILPMVGAFAIDIINVIAITLFATFTGVAL